MTLEEVAGGIWRWTARHPEWHPAGAFGSEVACFALRAPSGPVLVDPLLAEGDEGALDEWTQGAPVRVVITIPYHARSAAALVARHGGEVLGHGAVATRLPGATPFRAVEPGDELPDGIAAMAIGSPRRQEQPLWLPWARALAFGDAVVGTPDGLRVWFQRELTPARLAWHRRRFVPTLEPLLALEPEHVLVTHGPPALGDGAAAMRDALAAPPWHPR